MIAALVIPAFDLRAALRLRPGLETEPAALAPQPGTEALIGSVTAAAQAKGVRPGMVIGASDFADPNAPLSKAHLAIDPSLEKTVGLPFDFKTLRTPLILGRDFQTMPAHERFQASAAEALATFPHLQRVATTVRSQRSVDDHDLAAKLMSRNGLITTRTYSIERIIDRIGSGDAFAAGVLHGLESGLDDQVTLDFGLAAACLKHSIPGDFNLSSVADVHNLLQDAGFTVRR